MLQKILDSYKRTEKRLFLLDYDGTLVDVAPTPKGAKPTLPALEALLNLGADHKNTIVIVTGRDGATLDSWLGNLPLSFAAEHGAVQKEGDGKWQIPEPMFEYWKQFIRPIMQSFVADLPGSLIEEKATSLAWHYRLVEPSQVPQARASLIALLREPVQELGLQITLGDRVIEARLAGATKGTAAKKWITRRKWDFIFAAGDDVTDEDLFAALPPTAFSIKIGPGRTLAHDHLDKPRDLLNLFQNLVETD